MSKLGDKDAFPTPELKGSEPDAEVAAWAGPGLTVREYTAIRIAQGLCSAPTAITTSDVDIARMAVSQTDKLLQMLQTFEEGEVPAMLEDDWDGERS